MSVRPAALWLVALLLASCAREIRTADSGSIDAGLGADGTPEDTPDAASAPDSGLSSDSGVALDVEPPDSGAAPDSGVGPDSGELPDTGLAPDGGCVPACGTRTCGPDPVCGQTCGSCTDTQACAAGGMCLEECRPGATICSPDGFGLQSCGLNDVLGFRDYGARVPCAGGQACDPASHACQRSACLPAQVMIVLDRSASLSANSAWVWVKDDVLGTLRSHEHVGAYGLRTFPSGACAAGPVMTPALVSAAAIEAAIAPPTVEASSPLAAALSGLDAAFSGADEGRAIFLLTDGNDSCAPAGEAEAIVSRFHRAGIKTYTFALSRSADRLALDRLAALGGTGSATLTPVAGQLRRALDAALSDLGACRDPHGTVAAGGYHSCATYPDGRVRCWGRNSSNQCDTPLTGTFRAAAAATDASCALRADGHVLCWGRNDYGQIIAPTTGSFVEVVGGVNHFCARRQDGSVDCWGDDRDGQSSPPAAERFVSITAMGFASCGLRADHSVDCWGRGSPLQGSYRAIDGGSFSLCGIRLDGSLECAGTDPPPTGVFTKVSAGDMHGCAIRDTGELACWGWNGQGMATPPVGRFVDVSTGLNHSCAVREDDVILCFGADFDGQATPP